jgi:endonuclease/exonuclease/phosphatase (EEP) superfamily protein YafD
MRGQPMDRCGMPRPRWTCLAVAAGLSAAWADHCTRSETARSPVSVLSASIAPVAAAASLAGGSLAIHHGARRTGSLALAAGLSILDPRGWQDHRFGTSLGDQPQRAFSVFTANVLYTNIDELSERSASLLLNADVVALQEVSTQNQGYWETLLRSFPWRSVRTSRRGSGVGLWSRWPIEVEEVGDQHGRERDAQAVVLVDGERVRIRVVHTHAPRARKFIPPWREHLKALEDLLQGSDLPSMLVGDFNASRAHAPFRNLLRAGGGMQDAASRINRRHRHTWSPLLSGPRLLQLDHILVPKGWTIRDARRVPVAGSDHCGIHCTLIRSQKG